MDNLIVGNKECPFTSVCDSLKNSASVTLVYRNWMQLGRRLDIPPDTILSIERRLAVDIIDFNEAIYQVLTSWRSVKASEATLNELVRVLENLELRDAADVLMKAFSFIPLAKKVRPQKFSKEPKALVDFLESKETALVMSTASSQVTLDRIKETAKVSMKFMHQDAFLSASIIQSSTDKLALVTMTANYSQVIVKALQFKTKIMLITEEKQHKLMKEFPNDTIQFVTDEINWSDLTESFQYEITQSCGILKEVGVESLETVLHGEALAELIQGEFPLKMNETLPPEPSFYIPRRLKSRFQISKNIFEGGANNIYLFSGLERYELTEYAEEKPTDNSRNQAAQSKISVQFILLQMKRDFDKICGKTEYPVHWLHHDKGNFTLIKSKGNLSTIQKFVEKQQQEFTEEEFLDHLQSRMIDKSRFPVCISDSPGMGKSFLLANIGRKLGQSGHKIIFIVFDEFIRNLKTVYFEHEELLDTIVDVLASTIFGNRSKAGFHILKHILEHENLRFEVLFDELDEVNRDDMDLCYKCLRLMGQSFKTTRIWVATRLHLLNHLERTLEVLGYNISPFHEEDQVNFFVSYWLGKQEGLDLCRERLTEFSYTCLSTLKRNMNNAEEDIAGVPLQCLLIAEVYEESAVDYADKDNIIPEANFYAEIDIKSIFELYQALFAKKIRKIVQNGLEANVEDLMKVHSFLGLKLIFPEWAETFKSKLYPTNLDEAVLSVGILESNSTTNPFYTPRFVHRTFAEYFMCWFVVHFLEKGDIDCLPKFSDFMFEEVFGTLDAEVDDICVIDLAGLKFTNRVTCYFLNNMISKVTCRDNSPFGNSIKIPKYRPPIRDLALCCVCEDFENLFEFLDDMKVFQPDSKLIFNSNLLFISITHSSLPLLQLLLVHYEQVCEKLEDGQSVLNVAVTRGDYSIVEYLLSSEGFRTKVEKMESEHLLHDCVTDSEDDQETILSNKAQIIKLLVHINPLVLEEDYEGRRPIHCDCVHYKLLIELFTCGADPFSTNGEGDTVLHKAVDYLKPPHYFTMMKSIDNHILEKLVQIKGKLGLTPLHKLVGYKEVEDSTLQMFSEVKADFNSVDENEDTVFTTAIFGRKDKHLLEKLIEYGADHQFIDANKRTMLHVSAEYGNVDAVKLLVRLGHNVNAQDKYCHTPLHSALFGKQKTRFVIWDYLIEQGADEEAVEFDKTSMLHDAIKWRDWNSVKWFIKKSADCNTKNKHGNTALHQVLVTDHNDEDLVRLLINHGVNVAALNNEGETPLLSALKSRRIPLTILSLLESHGGINSEEIATLSLKHIITEGEGLNPVAYVKLAESCVRKGADVNFIDEHENTLLHLAAASACGRGVKYLLSKVKGLDFNAKNSELNTPLHSAVVNHDDKDVVRLLLKYGANLSSLNSSNFTPLHAAVKRRRSNISKLLIETGAYDTLCGQQDFVLFTAEHKTLSTFKMVCEKFCTLSGKRLVEIGIDEKESSCLHPAVRGGNVDIVKYLIHSHSFVDCLGEARMQDLVHVLVTDSKYKWTRKEWAANEWRRDEILELLVKKQPSLLCAVDSDGNVPLLARGVHLDLLECMINLGADVRAVDLNGDSVIHLATEYLSCVDFIRLMKLIIRKGDGDLLCSRGKENSTVLQRVAEKMWVEVEELELEQILELFISQNVDFKAGNDEGECVIDYASRGNCEEWVLEKLIQCGANNAALKKYKKSKSFYIVHS